MTVESPDHDRPAAGVPQPVHARMEMPAWVWGTMFGAYAVFFTALALALGRDRSAMFMIVVSIGYAVMYFGTSALLLSINPTPARSAFVRGLGKLQTHTGPMSTGAVAAQVLTVPICIAIFGIVAAVVRAHVG